MSIDKRRKNYLRVFLVFGALSGFLMDDVGSEAIAPVEMLSDVIGGVVLWLIFWWLWAREKPQAKQTWK
jgi:hypothetical protein